ncbi:MAG: cytochrome c oxidase assembly protein [Thermomicrobiales bacterium]
MHLPEALGISMNLSSLVQYVVPLHGDPRFLRPPFWSNWALDPQIVLGVFGLMACYVLLTGSLNERRPGAADRVVTIRQRISFVTGCVLLLVALGPPIEDWASLLVSGHMVQHLIIMFIVPPLLLYGTPAWLLEPVRRWPVVDRLGYWLTRPVVTFFISTLVIIAWHLPALYDLSLRVEPLHALQHMMYLVAFLLVWWSVLGPLPAWPRATPLMQALFVFALTLPGAIVGAFLTFGPVGYYPYYTNVPRMWGLDLAVDQQIAGLLMWVLGGALSLLLFTIIFLRWANAEDRKELASRRPVAAAGSEAGS